MHRCGHRRERINAFHPELPSELDEPVAEGISPLGWLGIANEYNDVVLAARVLPGEEPATRQAACPDQPFLHLDVLDVE